MTLYQGRAGDVIRVLATDAIEVVGVTVVVSAADGMMIETGPAVKDHDVWVYRCPTAHARHAPVNIEVTAENRAGTKGTLRVT